MTFSFFAPLSFSFIIMISGQFYNIYPDNSSLVTHPPNPQKTVVPLLRQGQKAVLLLHTPKTQCWQLLSLGIKNGLRQRCRFWQYYRNPLISRHFMYFYSLTFDINTTVSTCMDFLNISNGVASINPYPRAFRIATSLASVAGSQDT